ncbi:O-antigen ligase family protein, partial [Candidatus Dojkabacteria bacterium]|nr:O-antigen ligase family protein [Candidatus Dojkabacteria bacterium]
MIPVFFNILFFLIPLVFYKGTSELFEFNKIVTLYTFTALIVSAWALQSIRIKKFIFRKTILDLPLIIYLSIYLISALFSIDPRTSWLGYYSRFNGGFISQICYAILYWAFVSNINAKQALHSMYFMLLATILASILAIGEKFGIFGTCALMGFGYKESCWVQDVQTRVFSTLGQPNWLAAMIVALIPLTWYFLISSQFSKSKSSPKIFWFLISILFFVTLLFTKSRSGLLAFGIEAIIFWGLFFYKEKLKYLKEFLIFFFATLVLFISVWKLNSVHITPNPVPTGPVLESGGTESGTIRKFVWIGAVNVFLHYPIFGSGPETFAFSYPMFKTVESNLTSEWDFIYNKAHNEFLNYLANTGILGFSAYLFLIFYSIVVLWKSKNFALLSGYVAILITNFFGFSVVPVSLLFYLFPAVAIAFSSEDTVISYNSKKINTNQKLFMILVLLTTLYTLYVIR